jgi:predicted dinucleotide-binding enzyme
MISLLYLHSLFSLTFIKVFSYPFSIETDGLLPNFACKQKDMPQKEIIAVIGAASEHGTALIKQLVQAPYRFLLMDDDREKLAALQKKLSLVAETDTIACCREASWEADIIVIARPQNSIEHTAQQIREVATTKIVIGLTQTNKTQFEVLQQTLPNAKVVGLKFDDLSSPVVEGADEAAREKVRQLFAWENVKQA